MFNKSKIKRISDRFRGIDCIMTDLISRTIIHPLTWWDDNCEKLTDMGHRVSEALKILNDSIAESYDNYELKIDPDIRRYLEIVTHNLENTSKVNKISFYKFRRVMYYMTKLEGLVNKIIELDNEGTNLLMMYRITKRNLVECRWTRYSIETLCHKINTFIDDREKQMCNVIATLVLISEELYVHASDLIKESECDIV